MAAAERQMMRTLASGDEWQFYEYGDGHWTWRNVRRERVRSSERAFDTWIEAIADAIHSGFELGECAITYDGKSRRSTPRLLESQAT